MEISRALQNIRDFDSLIVFLRDALCWPIPRDLVEFDDVTYHWSAADLDLDPDTQERIIGCWQLRPLEDLQFLESREPWGVFFLQFHNDVDLESSTTVMRRVLRGLVERRDSDVRLPSWQHNRLLFICFTEDFQNLSFAYFEAAEGLPIFRKFAAISNFRMSTSLRTTS